MTLKITPQQKKVIERLLVERSGQYKANKTLLKFADQGIGTKASNNTILYTQADFNYFEALLEQLDISKQMGVKQANKKDNERLNQSSLHHFNTHSHDLSSKDNRLETAKYRADEKWSQGKVFATQMLVVGLQCGIPLIRQISQRSPSSETTGNIDVNDIAINDSMAYEHYEMPATVAGVLPTVLPQFLDYKRLQKLIIMENGQLMTHWWQWQEHLPSHWQQAVMLYRGHGDNLTWLHEILPKLSQSCEVLLCFDVDLAGLQMMSHYAKLCRCSVYGLLPQDVVNGEPDTPTYHAYNQPERVSLQLPAMRQTASRPLAPTARSTPYLTPYAIIEPLQSVYQTLVEYNLALMQEHIFQDDNVQWAQVRLR